MKKSHPSLFFREQIYLHQVWVSNKTHIQDNQFELLKGSVVEHRVECKKSSLESSRAFKIALFASYTFLISVFGGLIYLASILDPRFPF